MARTRVLLMGMPTMLRDVVRSIVEYDPALEIAGETAVADNAALLASPVDVLIAGAEVLDEAAVEDLLRRNCRLRVIGVATDGASATLFEMRPHREPLGELGAQALRSILRGDGGGS